MLYAHFFFIKQKGYSIKEPVVDVSFSGNITEYQFHVYAANGENVAWFLFSLEDGQLSVLRAEVFEAPRRKGIATAVYDLIEEITNTKITTDTEKQTDDAYQFWANRD